MLQRQADRCGRDSHDPVEIIQAGILHHGELGVIAIQHKIVQGKGPLGARHIHRLLKGQVKAIGKHTTAAIRPEKRNRRLSRHTLSIALVHVAAGMGGRLPLEGEQRKADGVPREISEASVGRVVGGMGTEEI